jgi:hypothetical protein
MVKKTSLPPRERVGAGLVNLISPRRRRQVSRSPVELAGSTVNDRVGELLSGRLDEFFADRAFIHGL